jgi:hypothetical protein
VIARIMKGRFVAGLLYYLYGPGKSDEHENPHLVAGWRDPIAALEPPVKRNGDRDFRRLTGLLNAPLDAIGRCDQPGTVWHCVLSAAPADRLLTDVEWNAIATGFMDQMGLAPRDDPYGIGWVAVRHGLSAGGIDHIHIAATLARQDGTLPDIHNDFLRARKACQVIEQQYGLTATAPADRTAAVRPTRAETEQTQRHAQNEPPRITLRRLAQEAAATAATEQDFFARLRNAGALIRERTSTTDPGQITGYAIALPSHHAKHGQPVWFGGGKLAPDLTLPRLRRRWERSGNAEHKLSPASARAFLRDAVSTAAADAIDDTSFCARLTDTGVLIRFRYSDQRPGEITGYAVALPGHTGADGDPVWYSGGRLAAGLTLPGLYRRWNTGTSDTTSPDPAERRALWDDVIRLTTSAAEQVRTDPRAAPDVAAATAGALRITARTIRGAARRDLQRAADDFDRAAREAYGAVPRQSRAGNAIRTATRLLWVLRTATGNPSLAVLVVNLTDLVEAAAELRAIQHRAHQAAAARSAAAHLRHLAGQAQQQVPVKADRRPPAATPRTDFPRTAQSRPPRPARPAARPPTRQRKRQGPAP